MIAKEYKPAPRWRCTDEAAYELADAAGKLTARIFFNYRDWTIRTRNRAGGWNYGYAKSLRAAKRKAAKMMREEMK